MQCFWFVPTGDLWRIDYQRLEDEPASAIPNGTPEVTAFDGEKPAAVIDAIMLSAMRRCDAGC